jgi:hypothetical protein
MIDTIRLVLPGSIRSKKNSKVATTVGGAHKPRRAILLPSKAYQKWEKAARIAAMAALPLGFEPWPDPVELSVEVFYKGPQPDITGCLESVGDCLEGILWINDKQLGPVHGARPVHDLENPRTVVIARRIRV